MPVLAQTAARQQRAVFAAELSSDILCTVLRSQPRSPFMSCHVMICGSFSRIAQFIAEFYR